MSSLQIGSSGCPQSPTQHGPSHSHLPGLSTPSQTRQRRRITKSNPSAITTDPETPSHTDQIPSSLSLLLDWLSIPGNYDSLKGKGGFKPQDGFKTALAYLKEQECPTLRTPSGIRGKIIRLHSDWSKAKDWKNRSGNGQGQHIINHAPASRRVDAERDVWWDILHLIFSDQDDGSIALRSDSTQSCNPVHRVLEDQPPNGPQSQFYASTGQSGFSQTHPSLSPSIQSSPRSLFAAQAGPSQYYDSTSQVRRATRLETLLRPVPAAGITTQVDDDDNGAGGHVDDITVTYPNGTGRY
nr:hypothetical protein L204_06393 [Cryptococcus depauperatus CBS 7855]